MTCRLSITAHAHLAKPLILLEAEKSAALFINGLCALVAPVMPLYSPSKNGRYREFPVTGWTLPMPSPRGLSPEMLTAGEPKRGKNLESI